MWGATQSSQSKGSSKEGQTARGRSQVLKEQGSKKGSGGSRLHCARRHEPSAEGEKREPLGGTVQLEQ